MIETPVVNPADMADPQQQTKIAAQVLQQLGLHPDQAGAKNLLDLHFQGSTASPEIKQAVTPLVDTSSTIIPPHVTPLINSPSEQSGSLIHTGNSTVTPTAPTQAANGDATVTPSATPKIQPSTPSEPAKPDTSGSLINPSAPTIPSPSKASVSSPMEDQATADQDKLNQLIHTGPGENHIKNGFLRGLAKVGDIAASMGASRYEPLIPGTQGNFNVQVKKQQGLVNTDLGNAEKESEIAKNNQSTEDMKNNSVTHPDELAVWMKENPDKPIEEYWKQKAQGGKLTPQEQAMRYYTTPKEEGGPGMTPSQAFQQVQKDLQTGKSPTTAEQEATFQSLLSKAVGTNPNPKIMSDPKTLIDMIANSPNLTPEEKQQVFAHLTSKTSPASEGGQATIRSSALLYRNLTPAIDTQSGNLTLITAADNMNNPGRFIPATQGGQSMTKESVFQDIHYNSGLVRDAMNNLKDGFSTEQRAKISMALSSSSPTAWDTFWHSSVAETLSPDQVDYVTSLAALHENAMAMRSIQGLGQGSDELRAAIRQMLPGAGTPTQDFGKRQLDIFDGVVNRLEQGVPHSGVPKKPMAETPRTGEGTAPDVEEPPATLLKTTPEGHYVTSPDGKNTWQKVKGKWVEYKAPVEGTK